MSVQHINFNKKPDRSLHDFYNGKNIFITGGSGFVGVCLIEKFLRCCPEIGNIYILLRPKKGKDIAERMEELKNVSVFEDWYTNRSEKEREHMFSKLKPVAGDIGLPNLGLSEKDRAMLCQEVNVIFHSAASLDFDAGLKSTAEINILGTRKVLELCTDTANLDSFVHVSSAYVNSWQLEVDELTYPIEKDVKEVINIVETNSEEALNKMTKEIIGKHVNAYTFTKHFAELEVEKHEDKFPCAIVRPSMITAAWKEPTPGWTISKNGPQGFLMGASKGVIRRLPIGKSLIYDYIPVDIVINNLIAGAYHAAVNKIKQVQVYHCTSSTRRPFKWELIEDKVNGYLHKYPLKSAVWYPHLKFLPSLTWFKISAFFVHILPAIFLDTLTRLSGGRPILMRLHRNVNNSLNLLEKFIFTEWKYNSVNTEKLNDWLTPEDRKEFGVSINNLDWRNYFIDLTIGVRKYLTKENPKNLAVARSKDKQLLVLHYIFMAALLGFIWYVVACIFGTTMSRTCATVPIAYLLLNML